MPTPCLAYLLDTPDEPGAVVTYRCARPAGHVPADAHDDTDAGRTWTATDDLAWAEGATYPVHTGWPWDTSTPAPIPPLPATPTGVDEDDDGRAPWAQLRDDAVARVNTDTFPEITPAEELNR